MARPRRQDQLREPDAIPVCPEQIVHVDAVRDTRNQLPSAATIDGASALLAAMGDPTRLRLVSALAIRELCVCDLAATLGLSQSAVSHQLRLLRQLGIVRSRRAGRLAYYALDDEHVSTLLDQALDHVRHQSEELT